MPCLALLCQRSSPFFTLYSKYKDVACYCLAPCACAWIANQRAGRHKGRCFMPCMLNPAQGPYRPFLPEEEGGEPHAAYAYALADAAAKAKGTMEGHEVRCLPLPGLGLQF